VRGIQGWNPGNGSGRHINGFLVLTQASRPYSSWPPGPSGLTRTEGRDTQDSCFAWTASSSDLGSAAEPTLGPQE